MVNRFEDLAPLVAPTGVARGSTVGFRQGVVESWNPTTGANTIRIGGTLFSDLPIIASNTEILLIQPGDVVSIKVVSGNSAFDTMYIEGRVSVPGTPETVEAIRAGIAQGVFSASVATFEQQQLIDWGDLPSFGPQLTNVPVGASGTVLVIVSAEMAVGNSGTSITSNYAAMSCEIRDAGNNVVRSPGGNNALAISTPFGSGNTDVVRLTASRVLRYTGLTPGSHTITAKYKSADGGGVAQWLNRNLTVLAI